jgi:uncharacterized protein YndB with AHSA1/START domain
VPGEADLENSIARRWEGLVAEAIAEIEIDGPIDRVFDIVTTTRHWPRWHPATLDVGGVTERPIGLGDVVHERAKIGPRVFEGNWTVVEHVRPHQVVLRILGRPLEISYAFMSADGKTIFRRKLDYPIEGFLRTAADPTAVEQLMEQQSAEGLRKLKALVEEELKHT